VEDEQIQTQEQPQYAKPRVKIVDTNEPGIMREKLLEIGWEQRKLLIADYWFFTHKYKKVGIERKEISDLLGSMGDRLSRQLENMLEHYDINILLIEGSWNIVSTNDKIISRRGIENYTRTMVWNYLRRFQDKGMTLELTANMGQTLKRLNELYALYQKPYSLSSKSRDFTDDRVLAFPSGCRGKTGMDAIEHFGSLAEVANADVFALQEVEGVGAKRAELIYNHFNRGIESIPLFEPESESEIKSEQSKEKDEQINKQLSF